MNQDVVCCLTPPGASAIAVVGLRGPNVWEKIAPFFTPASKIRKSQVARHGENGPDPWLTYGQLQKDGLGDEIVLVRQGHGEGETIELQLHGGPGVVTWCMKFAEELGCVRIEWADWLHDELWQLLPRAITKRTAGILLDQCQGAYTRVVSSIPERMNSTDRSILLQEVEELQAWYPLGSHLIDPWKIVLAGPPNVGKSSLLNALLGFERAITSPVPGTTRDLVTATVVWNGFPLEFVDTAGLRQDADPLESLGMHRTQEASQQADLILWLIDMSQHELILPDEITPSLWIGTKGDMLPATHYPIDLVVSATTGAGLPELLTMVMNRLLPRVPPPGQAIPVTARQLEELQMMRQSLEDD